MDRATLKRYAQMELSRREFWEYCKFTSPDFYREERTFLKDFAEKFQWFIEESTAQIMVVNVPPRHGKSRTATKGVQWLFGKYGKTIKVMTGSYNETLSGTFAKQVRDCIAEKPSPGIVVYNDIFPNTKIKYGEASMAMWALEGSEQKNYLATSPGGTATGFGCNIMIIDDVIKSADEAYNANKLEALKSWFTDTMLSRTENDFKIIVIMTRWSNEDLAGFILANYDNVVHINYKAVQDDGSMLCPDILSRADYDLKTKNMNKDIVAANYQQEPLDVKGRLYTKIKTYTETPKDDKGNSLFKYILNYTDTADEGSDNLCSICYGMYSADGKTDSYYILDVYYTKDATAGNCLTPKFVYSDNDSTIARRHQGISMFGETEAFNLNSHVYSKNAPGVYVTMRYSTTEKAAADMPSVVGSMVATGALYTLTAIGGAGLGVGGTVLVQKAIKKKEKTANTDSEEE